MSDPYDYPRCEICKFAGETGVCTNPGPVVMEYSWMKWPNVGYADLCNKFEKDMEALAWIHASVGYKAEAKA